MAIGPVQLIVLGFNHPDFHGEIISELERLRESDTVRVIDLSDGFISPLDLVEIGLMSAEEAKELHVMETAAAAKS